MGSAWKYVNTAMSFGITSAVATYVGYLGGSWVDSRLGTDPIFMFLGVILGIAASFRVLIRDVLGVSDKELKPPDKREDTGQDEP